MLAGSESILRAHYLRLRPGLRDMLWDGMQTKPQSTAFAERSSRRIHFAHKDMDYYLGWILGRETFGAADAHEVMAVVRNIRDGNVSDWHSAWFSLAAQTHDAAMKLHDGGNLPAAHRGFLRACTYHRAPLFVMGPAHPQFRQHIGAMQNSFAMAARCAPYPLQKFQFPFGNATLTGYRWRTDAVVTARPTLIVIGGLETWVEDCFMLVGDAPLLRGYNVFAADLSGQGTTPDQGLHFDGRMELPLAALLDFVLAQREVAPDQLAVYGFSWGGHIVFKGAAADPRIKALIANPAMPDVMRAAWAQQSSASRRDPVSRAAFNQIVWRFGLSLKPTPRNIAARFGKIYDYIRHGRAGLDHISCPTLLLAGQGEAPITLKIANETIQKLNVAHKHLKIFTVDERGEAHCQVNNPQLPLTYMLDWLQQLPTFKHLVHQP